MIVLGIVTIKNLGSIIEIMIAMNFVSENMIEGFAKKMPVMNKKFNGIDLKPDGIGANEEHMKNIVMNKYCRD
jgi:hypothetical protein